MFIYKTTNLINGKYYIGKYAGKRSTYIGSGVALNKAIEKYGRRNFKRIILEECDSLLELSARERYWIELFDAVSDPRSYNLTEGGHGGFSHITQNHYSDNLDKKYGTKIVKPADAITSDYIKKYVVDVEGTIKVIEGMDNVSKYLGLERSHVYKYLNVQEPRKGYKYKSLLIEDYTESYYLVEGLKYATSKEVCSMYNISVGVLHHRCLKSERMDWWKIVQVKDRWKEL